MMKKTTLGLLLAFLVLWVWTGACKSPTSSETSFSPTSSSTSSSNSNSTKTSVGFLRLILKDKPIDEAKNVWVTIGSIAVHKQCDDEEDGDACLITVYEAPPEGFEVDLLALKNTPATLVTATLETGAYNQIRMPVLSGRIVFAPEVEGDPDLEYTLEVPSDIIKIPVHFEVEANGTLDIILDFDAEKSIHIIKTGKKDIYKLRPVIKVEGLLQP